MHKWVCLSASENGVDEARSQYRYRPTRPTLTGTVKYYSQTGSWRIYCTALGSSMAVIVGYIKLGDHWNFVANGAHK